MRDSNKRQYTKEWLQFTRPQPMYDKNINKLYDSFYQHNPVHTPNLDDIFKEDFIKYLDNHSLNNLTGYNSYQNLDICVGCTQFIDDIYQRCGMNGVQILTNDYKYHYRLNPNINYVSLDTLNRHKELIIAMPFPYYGDVHPDMDAILDKCDHFNIPVHIDGAWISCCRNITFDFSHKAISSFCISLSKGGLGGNRIGVRFSRNRNNGAITIMNDFNMNNQSLVSLGSLYINTLGAEYFWKNYSDEYKKVCADFNLVETNAIHLARTTSGEPVGIRPLLRCLK